MITLPNDALVFPKWASLILMAVPAYHWFGTLAVFFVIGVWMFLNSIVNTYCIYFTSNFLMLNATLDKRLKKDESKAENLHG
jgi:hypothetical protein